MILEELLIPISDYHLKYGGQILNDKFVEKETGIKEQDLWFASAEDRSKGKNILQEIAKKHKVLIAFNEADGESARKKTIAKIIFKHQDRQYEIEYDFGYGYDPAAAKYSFEETNFSCDCNRSILIRQKYPEFEEIDCGNEIKMETFDVHLIEKMA